MSLPDTSPSNLRQLRHPAFLGFLTTQFLGAFNDNLFKQLLLLLAIPTVQGGRDLQSVATILFGLPFVIFGGLAGYLADKFSKRQVIVVSKVAEIVVMTLGLFAFLATPQIGLSGLWVVLFLMGLQSTMFGPGKYGILPEMMPQALLPRANGWVLMTTFIAIILGTGMAGHLKDALVGSDLPVDQASRGLWVASLVCIGIAVLGTLSSLPILKLPPADPHLKLTGQALGVPWVMVDLLRRDRSLRSALVASCAFWLIAGLALQSVNSLGKTQLGLSDGKTSWMVSLISVGIAIGGVAAGRLSDRITDARVLRCGMLGIVLFCLMLSICIPGRGHWLGYGGSLPVLILLGAAAAFFAIPIQVFLQSRPPDELKGRMIAVMNQANFFAIVLSGVLYFMLDWILTMFALPRSALFAAMAILFLPSAIFYRLDTRPLEN